MPDEIKKSEAKQFEWVESKQGVHEIYGNFVHPTWTLVDVRFKIGQLVPVSGTDPLKFVAEERAGVTMAWPHIKVMRDILIDLVANYEKVNGEIKQINLPPATSPPSKE